MQTLYLAGDIGGVVWPNLGGSGGHGRGAVGGTRLATRKQLS